MGDRFRWFIYCRGITVSTPVMAGSCCGCERCASQAISRAKSKSVTAFQQLHASIYELGQVFLGKSNETTQAIYAASENITTKVNVGSRVEKQMLDGLNAQMQIRQRQASTLRRKRDLEETYNPETVPENLLLAYGTQDSFKASDYKGFVSSYGNLYPEMLKQKRSALLSQYVIDSDEMEQAQSLLWGGPIKDSDEAANLVFVTQQLLFGGDDNPYSDVIGAEGSEPGISRDQARLSADRVVWSARIKPALDFFVLDHSLRTRPNEEVDSVMEWLDENIEESLMNAEGMVSTYANASRADIYEGMAVEQKKLNLLRYLNLSLQQIQERIISTEVALDLDAEAKGLRYIVNNEDFTTQSENKDG